MRSGAKVAVIGGIFAVVAGGVGYGGLQPVQRADRQRGRGRGPRSEATTKKTGPPSADEIETTAKDFLTAWAGG